MTGEIRTLNTEKGYGFIRASDGEEYFFHRSGVERTTGFEALAAGRRVEFTPTEGPKGPRAIEVRGL